MNTFWLLAIAGFIAAFLGRTLSSRIKTKKALKEKKSHERNIN